MTNKKLPPGVYWDQAKGIYRVRWTYEGRRYAASSRSLDGALAKRSAALAKLEVGKSAGASKIRLGDFAEHWMREVLPFATNRKGKPLAPGSIATYSSVVRSQVVPVLGPLRLSTVMESDVENLFKRMRLEGRSTSYLSTTDKALRRLFRDAKKAGHIDRIPLEGVVAPYGKESQPRVVPTTEQFKAMMVAATATDGDREPDPLIRAFIATIGLLGLRISEALSIRWSDYDTTQGTITVMGKGSRVRVVKVGRILAGELDTWRRVQLRMRVASPWWSEEDFMLSSSVGTMMDSGNIRKRFRAVADPILPGCTPHSLRHYVATALFEADEDIEVIAKHLGHATSETTRRVYVHVSDSIVARVADTMDQVVGG